ncbi:MAG: hypothetical protein PHH30_10095, partial [Bacteroidales bacterium]|nr:hypothetical protein [Bacteroidales bacterium]
LFGIYVCFYSWIGFTTIVVGAFLAFSYTSSKLDIEKKRIKYSSNLFGFISVGYWTNVKPEMNMIVRDCANNNKDSLGSNNNAKSLKNDFRIYLVNENQQDILAIKKFNDKLIAENEIIELKQKFELKNQKNQVLS